MKCPNCNYDTPIQLPVELIMGTNVWQCANCKIIFKTTKKGEYVR